MTSKLRLRGSMLISGNIGLLTLTMITAVVIIFSANLSVLLYEMALRNGAWQFFGEYGDIINLAVASAILLFSFSVYSQIKLGTDRFFLRRAQKKGGTAGDIFYYFHPLRAVGAIAFCLKMLFLKTFLLLISLVPCILSFAVLYLLLKSNVSALVAVCLFAGCVTFLLSGIVFYKNITLSFFLAKYYFIDGSFISFSHLIGSSQQDMKSRNKSLRRLKMSFFGWFALCFLIFPIGYVWSYYNQTMALAGATFMKN
ncbi:MAG: hypothetical protein IJ491_07210 [Clostridia bacterium]|nr:hypothetical protein [Clostridia bacterium]